MLLKCLIDHTHDSQHFVAGDIYEVEDSLGARLLRDFGGDASSEEAKRGHSPKFEATTERPTDPDKPEGEAPEVEPETVNEGGVCGHPVGNGSCVLEAGHAGVHRLTAPDEVAA